MVTVPAVDTVIHTITTITAFVGKLTFGNFFRLGASGKSAGWLLLILDGEQMENSPTCYYKSSPNPKKTREIHIVLEEGTPPSLTPALCATDCVWRTNVYI